MGETPPSPGRRAFDPPDPQARNTSRPTFLEVVGAVLIALGLLMMAMAGGLFVMPSALPRLVDLAGRFCFWGFVPVMATGVVVLLRGRASRPH